MKKQRLAVIMATHNDNEALTACMASLNASTVPFNLYLVDDAGKQPAAGFIKQEPHIRLTALKQNVGPAKARNLAIKQALEDGCEYIAIMDADDTVHPQRFEKQMAFLDQNKEIDVAGSWANVVSDVDGRTLFQLNHPCDHNAICKALNYNSTFVHPTAMFRSEVMRKLGGYDETFPVAQDYEIFYRASRSFKLANIPEHLVNYTWSPRSITATKRKQQLNARLRIQTRYFTPHSIHAWAGLSKTFVAFLMPKSVLDAMKKAKRCIGK